MDNQELYIQFGLGCLNYKSKQDLYENLYIKALVDSYQRADKSTDIENEIRDRFILDLINCNSYTSELVKKDILQIDFERWHFVSGTEKRRTDIVFFISGFGNFTVECKRLFHEESKNDEYTKNGLSRFINLKYSKENNYAAMVGFVISGDIDKIEKSILEKCQTVFFVENEFSKQPSNSWENSFKTTHKRVNDSEINIYHLLFEFKY
jgi:hypothetical protein